MTSRIFFLTKKNNTLKNTLPNIDKTWTIFLDRDGTINNLLKDQYVSSWEEFEFIAGAIEAIGVFNKLFFKTIIVTNQQGIGKEIMTHEELKTIHDRMLIDLNEEGVYVDQVYYCPELAIYDPVSRKPNPGMAIQAQEDFKEINFSKSIMVGDSDSDILFGQRLGMFTVRIGQSKSEVKSDLEVFSLNEFAENLLNFKNE